MTPSSPTWYAHPDLMNLVIIILALALLWFVRREFTKFDNKLSSICNSLDKKADKEENEKEHGELWQRANGHGHKIVCNEETCKPYTDGLLIHEEK